MGDASETLKGYREFRAQYEAGKYEAALTQINQGVQDRLTQERTIAALHDRIEQLIRRNKKLETAVGELASWRGDLVPWLKKKFEEKPIQPVTEGAAGSK